MRIFKINKWINKRKTRACAGSTVGERQFWLKPGIFLCHSLFPVTFNVHMEVRTLLGHRTPSATPPFSHCGGYCHCELKILLASYSISMQIPKTFGKRCFLSKFTVSPHAERLCNSLPFLPKEVNLENNYFSWFPYLWAVWLELSYPAVKTLISSNPTQGAHFQVCLLSLPGSSYLHPDLSASLLMTVPVSLFHLNSSSNVQQPHINTQLMHSHSSTHIHTEWFLIQRTAQPYYTLFQRYPKSDKSQLTKKHEESEFSKDCMQLTFPFMMHHKCILTTFTVTQTIRRHQNLNCLLSNPPSKAMHCYLWEPSLLPMNSRRMWLFHIVHDAFHV